MGWNDEYDRWDPEWHFDPAVRDLLIAAERHIDDLTPGAPMFWGGLAAICEPGCCGIRAFSFSALNAHHTYSRYRLDGGDESLPDRLDEAAGRIRTLDEPFVLSEVLNHTAPPETFATLFEQLAAKIRRIAADPPLRERPPWDGGRRRAPYDLTRLPTTPSAWRDAVAAGIAETITDPALDNARRRDFGRLAAALVDEAGEIIVDTLAGSGHGPTVLDVLARGSGGMLSVWQEKADPLLVALTHTAGYRVLATELTRSDATLHQLIHSSHPSTPQRRGLGGPLFAAAAELVGSDGSGRRIAAFLTRGDCDIHRLARLAIPPAPSRLHPGRPESPTPPSVLQLLADSTLPDGTAPLLAATDPGRALATFLERSEETVDFLRLTSTPRASGDGSSSDGGIGPGALAAASMVLLVATSAPRLVTDAVLYLAHRIARS